jgi:WD40 repeat protein
MDADAGPATPLVWRAAVDQSFWSPVASAPSGQLVAAGTLVGNLGGPGPASGSLTVLRLATGEVVQAEATQWAVAGLAFSFDSKWLAVSESQAVGAGPRTNRVRILEPDSLTVRCENSTGLPDLSIGLAFDRNGKFVVAQTLSFEAAIVYAFDAENGRELWRHSQLIFSPLCLAADSKSVAVGMVDGVLLLDTTDGTELHRMPLSGPAVSVAISPDNRWVAAGCDDGMIRMFDAQTGQLATSVHLDGDGAVMSVNISRDSRWLAAVRMVETAGIENAGELGVFDITTGAPRFAPVAVEHFGSARFSPSARDIVHGWGTIIPSATGHHLTVLDAVTGTVKSSSRSIIRDFAICSDGAFAAAGGNGFAELYDLGVTVSRFDIGAPLAAVRMSPAGPPLVAVADTSAAVTVLTAKEATRLARQPVPGDISDLAIADRGQSVVAAGSSGVRLFSIVGAPRTWTAALGAANALAVLGPADDSIAVAAGKNAHLLASADGQSRWPAPHSHPATITRIVASRDGKWIATGCLDRKTRLLDAATGAEAFSTAAAGGQIRAVTFASGSALLATANEDGTVILVDAAHAAEAGRVTRLIGCAHLAFSSDATLLATAWDDNTIFIHALTGGVPAPVRQLPMSGAVSGLAFNPIDNTLAVATSDTSVTILDAHSGEDVIALMHPQPVRDFAFAADGSLIATACDDQIVRVFSTPSVSGAPR